MPEISPTLAREAQRWATAHGMSVHDIVSDDAALDQAMQDPQVRAAAPAGLSGHALGEQLANSIDMAEAIWTQIDPTSRGAAKRPSTSSAAQRAQAAASQITAMVDAVKPSTQTHPSSDGPELDLAALQQAGATRGQVLNAYPLRAADGQTFVQVRTAGAEPLTFRVGEHSLPGIAAASWVDLVDALFVTDPSPSKASVQLVAGVRADGKGNYASAPAQAELPVAGTVVVKTWTS